MSIHAGEIPIEAVAGKLADNLSRFGEIVSSYRQWKEQRAERAQVDSILRQVLRGRFEDVRQGFFEIPPATAVDAYNRLTHYATHGMRSARTAFDMLERVNESFQNTFRSSRPAWWRNPWR